MGYTRETNFHQLHEESAWLTPSRCSGNPTEPVASGVKEYLSVRGIEFESVNVLDDEGGLERLRALGARSVPVVSRGTDFVFAQVIKDVVDFLGLADDTRPELSPAELAARYRHVLGTAIRLTRQMPDGELSNELPNRPRLVAGADASPVPDPERVSRHGRDGDAHALRGRDRSAPR